jgi:hypothetical protein
MPTKWYYISGCPFEGECGAKRTTDVKKKRLSFYGSTEEEAQEKCVNHLVLSSLQNKSKRVVWEAALDQGQPRRGDHRFPQFSGDNRLPQICGDNRFPQRGLELISL